MLGINKLRHLVPSAIRQPVLSVASEMITMRKIPRPSEILKIVFRVTRLKNANLYMPWCVSTILFR